MPAFLPNMHSVNTATTTAGKRARFVTTKPNNVNRITGGVRQGRLNRTTIDPVNSVVSRIPAGTSALDAQRSIYDTIDPGKPLHV